jgi:hypothetical protein
MASERPDGGSSSTGGEVPDSCDLRATVEWHFGELIEQVSVEHPVSRRELRAALATVEHEGQRREEELRSVGVPVQCEMPGVVFHLPGGIWRSVEAAGGVDQQEAVAARDVHRRMARTVTHCSTPSDAETDLFVLCSPRRSHQR